MDFQKGKKTKEKYKRKKFERVHRPSLSCTTMPLVNVLRCFEAHILRNMSHPEVIVLAELVDSFSGSFKV